MYMELIRVHAHIFLPGAGVIGHQTAEARIGAAAKGLIETAALVYQTDDFGLAAFWGLSGQGEHMVDDDIFFHRRETYILPSVGKRLFRMVEPMEPMGRIRCVPVIEKIIMQQRTSDQTFFIAAQMQIANDKKTEIGHSDAVEQHGGIAVLEKFFTLRKA